MEKQNSAPPIIYPRVKIGGADVELRRSFYTQFILSRAGIGEQQLQEVMEPRHPRRTYIMLEMLAAYAGWKFSEQGVPPPTADQWALRISQEADPVAKMGEIIIAIG